MAITFRSTPAPKKTNIKPALTGLVEPAAFFEVVNTAKNLTLKGVADFNTKTGRYAPFLTQAEISVEGDLGMLTRAVVTFVVETDEDFEKYTGAFLIPNETITINYGWRSPHPGWERAFSTGVLKNMVIYDFSFEYASDTQQYLCTFKAMAATATIDEIEFAISLPPEFTAGKKFITETWYQANIEHEVTSMTELILAQAQTNQPDPFDEPSEPNVVRIAGADNAYVLAVPFNIAQDVAETAGGEGVIIYVNLDYIVNYILNQMVIGYHKKTALVNVDNLRYELQKEIDITQVEKLFSPNPLQVVFPGDDISSTYTFLTAAESRDRPVLSFANTYTNGFSKCVNGNKLTLGNILISLDALIEIQKQVADIKDQKSKAESTDESSRSNILLSVKDFIKKISALINKHSGGLIDLVTYHPEDDSGVIRIVDRNFKTVEGTPAPLIFNNRYPGDGVTRLATIKAEVPKDALAMNAYLNNIKGVTADQISNDSNAKSRQAKIERIITYNKINALLDPLETPPTTLKSPKTFLAANGFNDETIETVSRQVREYVQNRPLDVVRRYGNAPYPLKLSLSLAGVEGFKFGDLVNLQYMPFQYTGKNGVCFRVIRVKHKFEGMNWTTDLETVCDLL